MNENKIDVLAVMDAQLRDRAERANRYRKNAEKAARKNGEPQITADRMAVYADLQLTELRQARAGVAELIDAATAMQKYIGSGLPVSVCFPRRDRLRDALARVAANTNSTAD